MTASSLAERLANRDDSPDPRSFLASHRAATACKHELEQLTDAVQRDLAALPRAEEEPQPVVRLSPGRCIVQLGPVALTLAWLRGANDSVADGELMVIVWRGAVATRGAVQPERPHAQRAPSATALWEDVFVAVADNEASWTWQSRDAAAPGCTSLALAADCVERLYRAHVAATA